MAEQFAWELRFHPQRPQVDFVLDGIRHGFKLGFSPSQKLKSAKKNKPSATQHASVIDAYLANEVSLGRMAGPFNSLPPFPNLQIPTRPMNGHFAFLSPSLLGALSIFLSRCIYLGLELSTSTMGSLIRLSIVFIFSGWYVVSIAVKVLLCLADFLLPMI